MPSFSLIEQDFSVVLVGDLNPKIFHPNWFAHNDLIRASEAEAANLQIVHQDVVNFSTDWFSLQVTRDRFIARTSQEPYSKHLYDLALGTFKKLVHTPIQMLGINHSETYQYETIQQWHRLGHLLTPKDIWQKFLKEPGMRSITIEGQRTDGLRGALLITIEPTNTLARGASFKINDHHEVKDKANLVGCEEMLGVLEARYFESMENAKKLIQGILEAYEYATATV